MTGCNAERSLTGFLVEPGTFTGKNELTLKKKKKKIKERKKEKNWINISKIVWKKASQREEKKKKNKTKH